MASINDLPPEIVCCIGEMRTWEVPVQSGQFPGKHATYQAFLARTNHYFYNILNPILYKKHLLNPLLHDPRVYIGRPWESCLLLACRWGYIHTLKAAHRLGADLNMNGISGLTKAKLHEYTYVYDAHCSTYLGTPLHLTVDRGDREMSLYLLENGAKVHVPSKDFYERVVIERRGYRFPYPLHCALGLKGPWAEDAAHVLIKYGAYLLAEGVSAFPRVAQMGRSDLIEPLLDLDPTATPDAALRFAAGADDLDLFKRLLKREPLDVSSANSNGQTALHIASQRGNVDFVELLLERPEVNVAACDSNGRTALHHAAKIASLGVTELLLKRTKLDAAVADEEGSTALHYAVRMGSSAIVSILLERPELDADARDSQGLTALHHAVQKGSFDIVSSLLERPEVNAGARDPDGSTALHYAVQKGNIDIVSGLLEQVEVIAGDLPSQGSTIALHLVVQMESLAIVLRLLERPEVNAGARDSEGRTPVHLAADTTVPGLIEVLIKRPDVDVRAHDGSGRTVLHYVSRAYGNTDSMVSRIEMFIERGVDVNQLAPSTGTALFYAVKHSNLRTALTLLSHGADPLVLHDEPWGWTMLHYCLYGSKYCHPLEVCARIMEYHDHWFKAMGHLPAAMRPQDPAFSALQTEVTKELLARGVAIDTTVTENLDDQDDIPFFVGTPLFFAATYANNVDCMRLLLESGAKADTVVTFYDSEQSFSLLWGDEQSLIAALIQYTFDEEPYREENLQSFEERICLLLKHGASLEGRRRGWCALKWGCNTQYNGRPVLNLLLDNASRANISIGYLKAYMSGYAEYSTAPGDNPEELERLKELKYHGHKAEVVEMLSQFRYKEFPESL